MQQRIEAHISAGLGGWWRPLSRGVRAIDRLMDNLSDVWDCNLWMHTSWERCSDEIIARQRRYKDEPKVILGGHSYGALRNIEIARRLQSYNIDVDLIFGIDPTCLPAGTPPMKVPLNVKHVLEFHATLSGPPKSCRRRDPSGDKGGKYVANGKTSHQLFAYPVAHVPIASDPRVVAKIMEAVKGLVQ